MERPLRAADALAPEIQRNWNPGAEIHAGESRPAPRWCPVHASRASRSDRCGRSAPTAVPGCRFCSAPLRHTFVDLGMSPLCESYVRAGAPRRDGAVLSAARPRLRALPAGPARGARGAGGDLHASTRTSPPIRTPGSPTRATTWSRWSSASGWARTARWSSWPATTATCSSMSSSGAYRRSGSSPQRTSPKSLGSGGSRPWSSSSAGSSRPVSWPRAARRTCWSPTTCSPTSPTSTTSPPACSGCSRRKA